MAAQQLAVQERFRFALRYCAAKQTTFGWDLGGVAASHCVFAELSWVPAEISQAEDRLHRIGAKDNVLVQHLVMAGSLDAIMARRLLAKLRILDAVLS